MWPKGLEYKHDLWYQSCYGLLHESLHVCPSNHVFKQLILNYLICSRSLNGNEETVKYGQDRKYPIHHAHLWKPAVHDVCLAYCCLECLAGFWLGCILFFYFILLESVLSSANWCVESIWKCWPHCALFLLCSCVILLWFCRNISSHSDVSQKLADTPDGIFMT